MAATNAAKNREAEFKWYVYALCDPRTNKPFYIGKGTGNRSGQHERDVRNGRGINEAKEEKIRKIISSGKEVLIQHLAYFNCETTSYNFETMLIKTTKGLTNIARNKYKPVVKSLFKTLGNAINGIGRPQDALDDLIMFKKIAVLDEQHQLIDQFTKVLKNQTYIDRVYG